MQYRKPTPQSTGKKMKLTGIVKQYGGKHGLIFGTHYIKWEEIILIVDIRDATTGKLITDHYWFDVGNRFHALVAKSGDTIEFTATIGNYKKKGGMDFRITNPHNLSIVCSKPQMFPGQPAKTLGTGIAYQKGVKARAESRSSKFVGKPIIKQNRNN